MQIIFIYALLFNYLNLMFVVKKTYHYINILKYIKYLIFLLFFNQISNKFVLIL